MPFLLNTEGDADGQSRNGNARTLTLIKKLEGIHGPLLFHQSGGCCDGSSPMCYPRGEFKVGAQDVYMGEIGGQPFYMGGSQFEYWQHTHLIIDVVPGRGSGFSVKRRRACDS